MCMYQGLSYRMLVSACLLEFCDSTRPIKIKSYAINVTPEPSEHAGPSYLGVWPYSRQSTKEGRAAHVSSSRIIRKFLLVGRSGFQEVLEEIESCLGPAYYAGKKLKLVIRVADCLHRQGVEALSVSIAG